MKNLSKAFDKKFVYKHKGIDYLQADPKDIKTFICQREKAVLGEVDIMLWKTKGVNKDQRALISKLRQSLVEIKKELSNE